MTTKTTYPLATGEADRQRLAILNRAYNPATHAFLKESGLRSNMTVLEVGCGTGEMACWLAQQVMPSGKVVATDMSNEQLEIARHQAKSKGITNIEFKQLDVRNLNQLEPIFDFTYGRWIIEFVENPDHILSLLHSRLKPGGILTYESTSFTESGHFSYPHSALVDEWFPLVRKNMQKLNMDFEFILRLSHLLKKLNCHSITPKTSQPILVTPEEKSVFRLGLLTVKEALLKNKLLTEEQHEKLVADFAILEQQEGIIGFFRNILVSGVK